MRALFERLVRALHGKPVLAVLFHLARVIAVAAASTGIVDQLVHGTATRTQIVVAVVAIVEAVFQTYSANIVASLNAHHITIDGTAVEALVHLLETKVTARVIGSKPVSVPAPVDPPATPVQPNAPAAETAAPAAAAAPAAPAAS